MICTGQESGRVKCFLKGLELHSSKAFPSRMLDFKVHLFAAVYLLCAALLQSSELDDQLAQLSRDIAIERVTLSRAENYLAAIESIDSSKRDYNTQKFYTELRALVDDSRAHLDESWQSYEQLKQQQLNLTQAASDKVNPDEVTADSVIRLETQRAPKASERIYFEGFEDYYTLKEEADDDNVGFRDEVLSQFDETALSHDMQDVVRDSNERIYSLYFTLRQQSKARFFSFGLPPPPPGYEDYLKNRQANAAANNSNVSLDASNAASTERENNLQMAQELRDLAAKETDPEKKQVYLDEARRLESNP